MTVAVLGSPEHDPASLDPASVRLGATGTEASPAQTAMEEVDLVLRFRTQEVGLVCGDTFAVLTGLPDLRESVFGSDVGQRRGLEG